MLTRWRLVLPLAALLVLGGLSARMLLGARGELARAAQGAARGEREEELRYLRRAMAYYLPGNPWAREAEQRLLLTARAAWRRGEQKLALEAYQELRSAVLALRGATRPFSEVLPEVNQAIAALQAGESAPLLARLAHPPEPHPGWAALGLCGFLLWVGAAMLLVLRGLRPNAALVAGRFWPLAGLVAVGLTLFCLGMARA